MARDGRRAWATPLGVVGSGGPTARARRLAAGAPRGGSHRPAGVPVRGAQAVESLVGVPAGASSDRIASPCGRVPWLASPVRGAQPWAGGSWDNRATP